ncbi:MAG: ABC transporter ATP-binding protein [Nitrospinota bacterium]
MSRGLRHLRRTKGWGHSRQPQAGGVGRERRENRGPNRKGDERAEPGDGEITTNSVKIRIENATKSFLNGSVVAFENLDLDVYTEEIICVLGPSGCGKTTLLRAIDGLLPLEQGAISIDGREVDCPRPEVAMVFQHFGLLPWKRLHQNVAYGLNVQKCGKAQVRERVEHYIQLVGLNGFENHFPYQLSGGMQQRAGLARALAVHPQVLLMDEPFGALDAQTREILQEELQRIWQQERRTMVFITHSIDEAILLGDRVAAMTARPGRIREILNVDFPRPRSHKETRASRRFAELHNHIWDLLRTESS